MTNMNKILVINDSRFERLILKDMLNRLGYSVKDTDEFISMRQIDLYDPDIIIVNRTMYDISGLDLIDMIKTKNPKYKCYLSSCSPLKQAAIAASLADGAFQTPIGIGELQSVMEGQESLVGELVATADPEEFQAPMSEQGPASRARKGQKAGANTGAQTGAKADANAGASTDAHAGTNTSAGADASAPGVKMAIKFCTNCGGDIRHEPPYTFCPFCGHKV